MRRALILSFINDPANKDVLSRITAVRSIIIQNPEYCATAAREAEKKFDYSPTSLDAAHNELDRLFTIYETGTILRSVQCRIGHIACPMGHYAPYFGDPSSHPLGALNKKKNKIKCNVCTKVCQSGHNCSYCEYNMCLPCSNIYCSNGHALKLWTHPESQHDCIICKKTPITAGYRCMTCDDYNICDLCTALPGRRIVQQVILDRMTDYLHYMDTHQSESATAEKTFHEHKRKMETNAYATTLDLYNFAESLHAVQDICRHEVFITRTTKEVLRLRAILSVGAQYSATAMRESLKEGEFTAEEISRLRILLEWSEREKSVIVRNQHVVACPLGHAAHHFTGRPLQYLRRDATLTVAQKKTQTRNLAVCKVCDRVCAPEGYHCDFCEYDLCTTCSVIWCTQGHAMKMWTVPEACDANCVLCPNKNLQMGYHCNICSEDVCDMSTTREGRGDIRVVWEKEMNERIAFMKANKRLSGVAKFYNWRHSNYIVSIGLLCEYVRELRTAQKTAENQIIQKPIIDKIKEYRAEIAKDVAFSALAVRETAKPEHYIFPTKKKAAAEATRLLNILQQGYILGSTDKRLQAGIACPLGHAMSPLDSDTVGQPYPPLPPPAALLAKRIKEQRSLKEPSEGSLRDTVQSIDLGGSAKEMQDLENELLGTQGAEDDALAEQILQRDVNIIFQDDGSPQKRANDANKLFLQAHEKKGPSPLKSSAMSSWQDEGEETLNTNRTEASSIAGPDLSVAMSDVYSEDEEVRLKNQRLPRQCRVCATDELCDGHFCPLCEYDLCGDCSVVYCRLGHALKIWTFPEATTLTCDMCKKAPIQSGYRCITCDIDVCDMCTTQDSRNAFMLWPRRELGRVMGLLRDLQEDSEIARGYLAEQAALPPQRLNSMSLVCKKLKEAEAIKTHVDEEIRLRRLRMRAKQYGLRAEDM